MRLYEKDNGLKRNENQDNQVSRSFSKGAINREQGGFAIRTYSSSNGVYQLCIRLISTPIGWQNYSAFTMKPKCLICYIQIDFFLQKEKSVYWYIMEPGNRKKNLKKELDFIRMHG